MLNWNQEYENRFEHKPLERTFEYQSIVIDTKRLNIRPISLGDKISISEYYNESIAKYLYYKSCSSIEDAEYIINRSLEWMQKGDRLVFSIFDKSNNEFLGCFGIFKLDTTTPELGFVWIKQSSQKQWFISEASIAILKWICLNINFNYLYSFVDERNAITTDIVKWWWWIVGEKLPPMETQDPSKILYVIEYRLYRQHLVNFLGI